jgi:ribonucleotide monophosphatase NagD (HAD superfamily)
MALKGTLNNLVSTAIKIIGDIPIQITYVSKGLDPVYDPVTDTETSVDVQVIVKVVKARYKAEEINESIIVDRDAKFIIANKDLNGVVPKENDYFLDENNLRWAVRQVKGVPGDSVWILQCRKA